ncbi:respiratory nitrate reductase 1 subunit beta [Salmonella enterica subsp. arizonae]|uniref:Respiratory nitrate reductase 1 subunit beta n=1 Tax=Salmonella enterica subsp. arizonae TaxID=59203 RepID=A0A2X4T9Z2_SALER|nr:respiratory nitrate reductase 1 subunit beta [Salmonella enterica subsp. arizonae]
MDSLRIPVQYLANLLTAGDTQPVLLALKRMLAMRHYKRAETVDGKVDTRALEEVGLSEAQAQEMYRLPGDCQLRRSLRGAEQSS